MVQWKLDYPWLSFRQFLGVFYLLLFVFRAVKVGPCAVAVKPTDLPERITAGSVRGVYAAWTTTVPGEKTPSIFGIYLHLLQLLLIHFFKSVHL